MGNTWPKTCARCPADLTKVAGTMSMFNTDSICINCKEKEKKHPDYEIAVQAELEAVKAGDYNFPGIGYRRDK